MGLKVAKLLSVLVDCIHTAINDVGIGTQYLNTVITPPGIILKLLKNLKPKNNPRNTPTPNITLADCTGGNCVVA